jgi:hypothetical protein
MLWEMAAGLSNDYTVLAPILTAEQENPFLTDGKPLKWKTPPKVIPYVDPRRKRQKPRADIEYLTWGAIVLNARAHKVLHDHLSPFGEFLPLDCQGEILYFYNITTLYSVIDHAKSVQDGMVSNKPCFIDTAIPAGFCIFKDELTAALAIYLNAETKAALETTLNENKLVGLTFGEAGRLL